MRVAGDVPVKYLGRLGKEKYKYLQISCPAKQSTRGISPIARYIPLRTVRPNGEHSPIEGPRPCYSSWHQTVERGYRSPFVQQHQYTL